MRDGRALGGARKTESGETLVELMVTIAVLGIAMVAILGALWTTLRIADFNSKTSDGDTLARTFAETMKEGGSTDTYKYVPCTVAGGQVTYPVYTPTAPYDHYAATVTHIRYVNGYSVNQEPVWADACPAATDGGLQELTLVVTGPDNDNAVKTTQTITIVKRDARSDVPRTSSDPVVP